MNKEEFIKVWKDSSRESILNQYYYDYKTLREVYDNWNELKESIKRRIKSYEDREKLGKGYELTEVMQISLACDRRFLKMMEEIESRK